MYLAFSSVHNVSVFLSTEVSFEPARFMPIYYSLLQMYYDLFSHLRVVEHRLLFFYLSLLFVQVENVFVLTSLCSLSGCFFRGESGNDKTKPMELLSFKPK